VWFNKTTVHSVTVHDQVSDSPDQTTTYSYSQPAWHRNDSDLTDDQYRTWDQFRGFRTVTTTTGNSATNQVGSQASNPVADLLTQTTTTYAQGMDGDYKADGSQRSVPPIPISAGGTTAETVTDSDYLAGTRLKVDTYTKAGGTVESSSVVEPPTATATASVARTAWTSKDPAPSTLSTLPPVKALRTTQAASDSYDLLSGTQGWRHTRTVTSYDSQARVTSVDNLGDVSVPSQEMCTLTSYATPPASDPMMLDYPDEVVKVAGPCGTTPSASAPPISDVRTFYDGDGTLSHPGTLGTLNTTGLASATEHLTSWPVGGSAQWTVEGASSYDQYGRSTVTYDVRGNKATASYTPASAGELPNAISTVTAPVDGSASWTTSATLDPERGLTLTSTDVNGGVTSYVYDTLGRTTAVWGPGHPKAANASTPQQTYTYAVNPGAQVGADGTVTNPGAPSSVVTKTLLDDGYYSTSTTVYDGMMQRRETQANALTDTGFASDSSGTSGSGASERLVSDTFYDAHGWAWDTYPAYYDNTSGPTTTMSELPQSSAPVQTVTVFDGRGRATASQTVTQGNQVQWQSTTSYPGADQTVATAPAGGPTTQTFTDALGRTTKTVVENTDPAVTMAAGRILPSGSKLESASSRLEMQPGGDLVLSSLASGKTLWHSTTSTPGSHAQLGTDGNLDVVTPTGAVTNVSGLASATGNTLRLGNDGSLTVTSSGGTAVWTSATAGQASAANSTTSYTYYPAGQVKTVQDSAGNTWSATYDLLGQKTSQADPNMGTTTYGPYDSSGNLLQTTDPAGKTLSYHYDWANRQVETVSGAYTATPAAGTELDSTVYDTLRKGAQTSATSYVYPSGGTTPDTYTSGVTGYNAFGKPTGQYLSIPAGDGFTQPTLPDGAHETTSAGRTVFEQDDYYTSVTGLLNNEKYGTEGGLPAELVAYGYNAMDEFTGLGSSTGSAYVDDSVHDGYGHTISATYGGTGEELMTTADYDQATGRLLDTSAALQQSTNEVDRTDYRYNAAGEITALDDWQIPSGQHDLQCFSYNSLQRLTGAWSDTGTINEDVSQQIQTSVPVGGLGGCTNTSPTTAASTTQPNTTTVGGPAPYWQTYTYDLLGDRTELVQHDPAGDATKNIAQQIAYPGTDATKTVGNPDQATTVTTSNPTTGTATSALGYQGTSQAPVANAGNVTGRSTTTSGPIISGIKTTSGSALCLTDPSASTTDGTQQTITGCGGTGQTYAIGTDGTVKIAGKCLDASVASPIIRTPVVINTCSAASTTQKWKATASGTLVNAVSGLCLADPSSNQTPGTKEWLWTCGATGEVFTTATKSQIPASGQTQTLTYDTHGRTASVATGDGTHTNTSTYLYDAGGNLLEQTSAVDGTDTTRILYLFGGAEQITLNVAAQTSTGLRTYTGPDGTQIIRDQAGNLSYQLAATQTTGTLLINAANDAVTRRYYDPYGNPRGTTPTNWISPNDTRGFLNQPADTSSALDLLGARQYDPAQGRFLSPDPIFEAGDPNQMGGYTYAGDNPTTHADPNGLQVEECATGALDNCSGGSPTPDSTYHANRDRNGGAAPSAQQAYANNTKAVLDKISPKRLDLLRKDLALYMKDSDWATPGTGANDGVILALDKALHGPYNWHDLFNATKGTVVAAAVSIIGGVLCPESAGIGCLAAVGAIAGSASQCVNDCSDATSIALAAAVGAATAYASVKMGGLGGDDATSVGCNSFSPDTKVLLANGKTKAIKDVKTTDVVEAADPQTGHDKGPRSVTATMVHHDDNLIDLRISTPDGHAYVLHTTTEHPFWDATLHKWVNAAELVPGHRLATTSGQGPTVTKVTASPGAADRYNLTIDQLHTYYVLADETPVLVHNSSCLTKAGNDFPGVAHTLEEHAGISDQEAIALAERKPGGMNSVFVDQQTAQQVADYATANNAGRIQNWLRGPNQQLTFSGRFGANNSLGTTFRSDGSSSATGNGYFIQLTRAKGYPGGFYISTLYPK
jgi:RHS repeat-associated protein